MKRKLSKNRLYNISIHFNRNRVKDREDLTDAYIEVNRLLSKQASERISAILISNTSRKLPAKTFVTCEITDDHGHELFQGSSNDTVEIRKHLDQTVVGEALKVLNQRVKKEEIK